MVLQGISQTLIANGDLPTSLVEQILIAIKGLSAFEVDQVLVAVRDLSVSQGGREEQETHEPHNVADLEVHKQHLEEIQESWTTTDKEWTLEPKIKESPTCLTPYFINEDHISKDLLDMIMEDLVSQENLDYIEGWIQTVGKLPYCSLIRKFTASFLEEQLVSHVRTTIEVYFPYLDMSLLINLFRTWLHWKFSYT